MSAANSIQTLLLALIGTVVVEALTFFLLGIRSTRIHRAILLVNCVTNPVLTLLNGTLLFSFPLLIKAECAIVIIEYGMLRYILGLRSWGWFTMILVANGVSFSAGLLLYSYWHPAFPQMVKCSVTREPIACLQQWVIGAVERQPTKARVILDEVYHLWPVAYRGHDRRILSNNAHTVGAMLGARYPVLSEALSFCSRYWFSGCIHGATMEHIRQVGISNSKDILNVCRNVPIEFVPDCLHGAGHALWKKTPDDNLNHVLASCKKWSDTEFSACVSGVLMEYSTGDTGNHSHDSQQKSSSRTLPCKSLDQIYQPTCYVASASYMTYHPDDSFSVVRQYCEQIPAEYQVPCFHEISRRRILSGI